MNTDCQLTLVGYLKAIPDINDCQCILLERQYEDNSNNTNQSELFYVHINDEDFFRIHHFGFLGMLLFISGDIQETDQKIKIIAKKVDFLHIPKPGKLNQAISLSDDMLFDVKHVATLKNSPGYQSSLYFTALQNMH